MSAAGWLPRLALVCFWVASGNALHAEEPAGRGRLVLWHAYRAAERDALESLVSEYNAQLPADAPLVEPLAIPYDALVDKITAAVPRGRGPDVFIFAHDAIGDWAEAGILMPMENRVPPTLLKSFHEQTVPPLIYNNTLYGLPLAFKSAALIYRTDKVKKPPETTDEMIALARSLTRADVGQYGLVHENGLLYFHAVWLFGFGGGLFGADGRPALATPQNVKSLEFASRLLNTEKILPQEVNGAMVTSLIQEGKAAMAITGPWLLADLPADTPVAVAPLPVVSETGRRGRPFMTAEGVFVVQKTRHPEASLALAQWLSDEHSARVRLVKGLQPVAHRAAWNALPDGEGANLKAFLRQLPDTVATPNTPAMKSLWSPMDNAINLVLHQTSTAQDALNEAQAKVADVIAKVEKPREDGPFPGFLALMALLSGGALFWGFQQVRGYRAQAHTYAPKTTRLAYMYAFPALVAMGVLTFVPFVVGLGMGFYRHTYGTWDFVGLGNYRDLLSGTDGRFFYTLGVTLVWTAVNVTLHVSVGLALALLLNRPTLKGRAVYRVLLIVPWAVPSYITALIWKGMFHPDMGAVNQVLAKLGFNTLGMSWMADVAHAFAANLTTNVWLGFPFMMVVCLGALQSIPTDLYEAARLDGATGWQQFSRITLPLLQPALVPAVLLGSVWTFNQFNVVYLVSGGNPDGRTDLLVTEAFRWAFERGPGGAFGLSAAYSTLIFLILLAYTLLVNRVTGNLDKALE